MIPHIEDVEIGFKLALIGLSLFILIHPPLFFFFSLFFFFFFLSRFSIFYTLTSVYSTDCIKSTRVNREVLCEFLLYILNKIDEKSYSKFFSLSSPTNDVDSLLNIIADLYYPLSKTSLSTPSSSSDVADDLHGYDEFATTEQQNENSAHNKRIVLARQKFLSTFQSGQLGRFTLDDLTVAGPL
jgi:hypothetical protein